MGQSVVLFLLMIVAPASGAIPADAWKGRISDKMCGADHKGQDPVACTRICVKHGSSYVFVAGQDKVLDIENQKDSRISAELYKFAGRTVTIAGIVSKDGKSVRINFLRPEP